MCEIQSIIENFIFTTLNMASTHHKLSVMSTGIVFVDRQLHEYFIYVWHDTWFQIKIATITQLFIMNKMYVILLLMLIAMFIHVAWSCWIISDSKLSLANQLVLWKYHSFIVQDCNFQSWQLRPRNCTWIPLIGTLGVLNCSMCLLHRFIYNKTEMWISCSHMLTIHISHKNLFF